MSHQLAFFVAVIAGVLLVRAVPAGPARWGVAVYATSLATMFGVSATYHRVWWSAGPRAWMRRADHSAIYLLIAGTYTPLCVSFGAPRVLVTMWIVAALGVVKSMIWPAAPRALTAALYVAMGWAGVYLAPAIQRHAGAAGIAMIVGGGLLFSAGALIYALKKPNPIPDVFGYHEVFHALVVAATGLHFAVIARLSA